MSFVTVRAHYDGEKVCLDEPIDLPPNTPMLVTIPKPDLEDDSRAGWFAFAQSAFAHAYGDDEPDYSDVAVREPPSQ